jgi:lipid-binding SYLF domain-containing protein
MTRTAQLGVLVLAVAVVLTTPALAGKSKADKERDEIRKKSRQVLSELYKVQPSAQAAVNHSAGYAVFSNFGMKILVAGGGSGKGVAVDRATKQETFMKMVEIQAGLGFGVKKFSLVWVFETKDAFRQFVDSGWELGAQTSVAAKAGDQGASFTGAVSISPGVWLYQLTDTGLALELTAKGTKYYQDGDLN